MIKNYPTSTRSSPHNLLNTKPQRKPWSIYCSLTHRRFLLSAITLITQNTEGTSIRPCRTFYHSKRPWKWQKKISGGNYFQTMRTSISPCRTLYHSEIEAYRQYMSRRLAKTHDRNHIEPFLGCNWTEYKDDNKPLNPSKRNKIKGKEESLLCSSDNHISCHSSCF